VKKFEYITVLRALAILGVLSAHIYQITAQSKLLPNYLASFLGNGDKGVELFYLLSAFTLFHSMSIRNKEEKSPNRNFFIRRFFRIAPMYYLAIIYYLWQDGFGPRFWLDGLNQVSALNIVSNFTFLHGFNPYWINSVVPGGWSVGIEMVFYCMLPFLFSRIKNIQHAANFIIITYVIRFICFRILYTFPLIPDHAFWYSYLHFYFPNQLPVFALGIFLYFLIYDDPAKISRKTLFLMAIILIVGINPPFDDLHFYAFCFILLALALERYHPKVLFNKFILHIGNISYSIYLTHFAVIYLFEKLGIFNMVSGNGKATSAINYMLNYAMLLLGAIVVSTITYILIEVPMQKVGKNMIRRLSVRSHNPQVDIVTAKSDD
jgi:peptidoglycan/LPS O-acetylase OafA/YrhL